MLFVSKDMSEVMWSKRRYKPSILMFFKLPKGYMVLALD